MKGHRQPSSGDTVLQDPDSNETGLPRFIATALVVTAQGTCRIKGVSITAAGGEIVALVGPPGSGKTSFLSFLIGDAGLYASNLAVLGVLKVRGSLVHGTAPPALVGSNLVAPPRDRSLTGLQWLADRAMAAGEEQHSARRWALARLDEFGLSTPVERSLQDYAPDEMQVLRVAGAAAGAPPVVVLDEPTAGLCPVRSRLVRAFLHRLRGRGTAVVVSVDHEDVHSIDGDRFYILRDGAVVARGTLHELRVSRAM